MLNKISRLSGRPTVHSWECSIAAEIALSSLALKYLRGSDGDALLPLRADGLRLHVTVDGVLDLHHLSKD